MTSKSKNVFIDELDDLVNTSNNTNHRTIKMKPVDVKQGTYINLNKKSSNEDPKFKIVGIVRISKYKNIFAKGYVLNWAEKFFVITKVKNKTPWTYVIRHPKGKNIVGAF